MHSMGRWWWETSEVSIEKALITGSVGKDKVGTGKGLYLHKGLDRSSKKGVTLSPLET